MTNWLNDDLTHRLIVEASEFRTHLPVIAIARANYLEARQRSLDLNQSSGEVRKWREETSRRALELLELLH